MTMEPVFVAEYTVTPGLFQEACCRIRRTPMIIFGIAAAMFFCQLLAGVAEAVFMLTMDWDAYDSSFNAPLLFSLFILRPLVPFLLFSFLALQPLSHAKKLWAHTTKYERFTASFYEDHMEAYSHCDGGTTHFNYEYIRKIVCSRNYIIIRTKSRLFRPIPKTSLTKGTPAELEAFLKNKAKTTAHASQTAHNI